MKNKYTCFSETKKKYTFTNERQKEAKKYAYTHPHKYI